MGGSGLLRSSPCGSSLDFLRSRKEEIIDRLFLQLMPYATPAISLLTSIQHNQTQTHHITNPLLPSYLLCISDVIYVMDDYPSINVLLMMLLPLLTSKQRMPKWQSPTKPIPYNQYVM